MPEKKVVAAPRMSRGRWLALVAGGLVVLGVGAAVAGSIWATGLVESRLRKLAAGAGLGLQAGGISVSPMGEVKIDTLRLVRPDGTDLLAVERVGATLPPWRAITGSRRPETLEVDGLRANLRLQDGRPDELIDLLRSARAAMGRKEGAESSAGGAKSGRRTAVTVRDSEVVVELRGAYADLLPGGLKVQQVQLRLAPDDGVGEMAATIVGAAQSKLSAALQPAADGKPPRVVGKLEPPLRLPLPPLPGLAALADHLVVDGFDYDTERGPSVRGVQLVRGAEVAVRVAEASLATGSASLDAGPIAIAPETAKALILRALDGRAEAKAGADAGAGEKSGEKASGDDDDAKDDNSKDDDAAKAGPARRKAPRKRKGGKKGKADDGFEQALRAALDRHLPTTPLTIAEVQLGAADGGGVRAAARKLSVTLGGELGTIACDEIAATRSGGKIQLGVTAPTVTLRWSEPLITALPSGGKLWQLVQTSRERPSLGDDDEEDDGEELDRPDLAPEARAKPKKKARRRKSDRPVSAKAIAPLQAAHAAMVGLGPALKARFVALDALPGLGIQVEGAAVHLLEPAAQAPFAGLHQGGLTLTPRLDDGSRGIDLSVGTHRGDLGKEAAGGSALTLRISLAKGGVVERAELGFAGGAFAAAAAAVGAAVTIGPDASIDGKLNIIADPEGAGLRVEGKLQAKAIGIDWWRLSKVPIDGLSFGAELALVADAKAKSIKLDISRLSLGEAHATFLLEATEIGPKATVHVHLDVPEQDCGAIAAAIPPSLVPSLGKLQATGKLSGDFDFKLPLGKPYKGKLDANLQDEACTDVTFEKVDLAELQSDFSRPVNESGTLLEDQLIGPSSEAWVPLAEMPPWVPYAMMATEDAAFYHHRGLRLGLLSRAIKMNLDYGRFVYGGSTLTQQLVKNLYLTRDKYLGRKFEELLIVWHMERSLGEDKVKTKDRILELYCNAVEFAPHLYGVERAAQTYFGKSARQLSPLEVAFLAANKPHPKVGFRVFEQKKWTDWWQERMIGILRKMRADEIITEQQFVAEAPYVPRFLGWPAPEKPTADTTGAVGVGGVEE